jgi:hypothetical protein
MRTCPRCQRAEASERSRCHYCGADLAGAPAPAKVTTPPAGASPGAAGSESPAPARAYLVIDASGVDAEALAAALRLTAYEAGQRARRGGMQLLRLTEEAEATREASRLAGFGLAVLLLPEPEVRQAEDPVPLSGGRLLGATLLGHAPDGEARVARGELLLVVSGPIRRAYGPGADWRRRRSHVPGEGYRFHLHRLGPPRPLEIDPGAFEFPDAAGEPGSSLLRLVGWIETLAAGAAVDDAFRTLAPALAPAADEPGGGLLAARALRHEAPPDGKDKSPALLDNLRQFRAYSAWRGVAERRRRLSHAPRHP